jgi:predicted TIM-barrel fold metal-dependent hydrolase
MRNIIDFHTHAFPDEIAVKAMKSLEEEGEIKAHLDGRVSSLLASMDTHGIEKSLVCSIATKPSQYDSIMSWSKKIRSERIIPLPSVHPDDPEILEHIAAIKKEGFKGIKFHPYYQDFSIDEDRFLPVYKKIAEEGLIIVMHTGFDFAFEKKRIADPEKIIKIYESFPDIKLVTTHLGAWDDWGEVEKHLSGKKIYMEISFSIELLKRETARRIIQNHPREYIFFGTDSPWTDQGNTISLLKNLDLGEEMENLIFYGNAETLLNSD